MLMSWTDDPVADFLRHDAEQEENLSKLPRCCHCRERIQDDICYRINDDLYCENCHNDEFRVWTEDVME